MPKRKVLSFFAKTTDVVPGTLTAKLQQVTFELARLKAWKFGAKTEAMTVEQRRLFKETVAEDEASLQALHQAHHDGGTLAREFAAGEQPCLAPHSPRAQEVFKVVVLCALQRHV